MYPDVQPFFKALREKKALSHGDSACIVGVITNSDDRVPSILSSLGLQVGLWRYGNDSWTSIRPDDDIHFVLMSYDIGLEKPDSEIFDSVKQMLPGQERFLHIGDDLQKDYYAAKRAGWEGFLLDREAKDSLQDNAAPIPRITNLQELIAHIR